MDDLAIKARLAKALLFINYFGFPQKAEDILDIASNFKLPIIEDCAHSYLIGNPKVSSIGRFSDYIIGSTRKFVPGIDGGILVSTSNALKLSLQKQSFFDEIKNIVNLYQRASEYSRGGLPGVLLDSLERLRKRTRTTPPEPMIASKRNLPPADWLGANDREKSISLNSRFQISRAKPSWIAQRRRNIFNRYLKELQGLRAKPLLPMLPDTVIPYVFPLLLDEPAPDFHNLKMAGVPIYRWEEIALTDCPVATDYRLRLIQLPCHQSLTDEDLEWILEQLQTFLS
jgi:dTDP-4-amino-4,6-dideoxygalactose transaminase